MIAPGFMLGPQACHEIGSCFFLQAFLPAPTRRIPAIADENTILKTCQTIESCPSSDNLIIN